MTFDSLLNEVTDKNTFGSIRGYVEFAAQFLEFTEGNLQARIVSRNEPHYQFLQYGEYASYQITRPINSILMYNFRDFQAQSSVFTDALGEIQEGNTPNQDRRETINRYVYTLQQSIGAVLDGLPAGRSNQARKLNGDLFEQLIRLIINRIGVRCVSGNVLATCQIGPQASPDDDFQMKFQNDLIVMKGEMVQMIGSVKTSSKDRLAKIFTDKLMFERLTGAHIPHVAIFLNDVQRRGKTPPRLGIGTTFLPGHFRAFTLKLNPLDGIYYCDLRPNMRTDEFLRNHIRTFDNLICDDIAHFGSLKGARIAVTQVQQCPQVE